MTHNWIQFKVSAPVEVRPDPVGFVSYCPPLDIYSQGPTEEEALENIVEAIQLFLESCFTRGTLDKVLRDCGFELDEKFIPSKPNKDEHMVAVPLSLVARDQAHAA